MCKSIAARICPRYSVFPPKTLRRLVAHRRVCGAFFMFREGGETYGTDIIVREGYPSQTLGATG